MRSAKEIYDLDTIGVLADEWGYGNVIHFLQNRWADMLMKKWGMTPTAAGIGAGLSENNLKQYILSKKDHK